MPKFRLSCRLPGLLLFALLLGAGTAWADPPHPPAPTAPGEREVTVQNRAPRTMNELYASAKTAEQWGDDRLGDHVLAAGDSVRLRLGRTRECTFDFMVVYDDASREERRGVDICRTRQVVFDASAASAPPEAGTEHQVLLLNRSALPIQQLFLSPPEANQWGEDRLVQSSISVGGQRSISWRGECLLDLRVVFENRSAEERRGIDLCSSPQISIQPGWTTTDTPPTGVALTPVP